MCAGRSGYFGGLCLIAAQHKRGWINEIRIPIRSTTLVWFCPLNSIKLWKLNQLFATYIKTNKLLFLLLYFEIIKSTTQELKATKVWKNVGFSVVSELYISAIFILTEHANREITNLAFQAVKLNLRIFFFKFFYHWKTVRRNPWNSSYFRPPLRQLMTGCVSEASEAGKTWKLF